MNARSVAWLKRHPRAVAALVAGLTMAAWSSPAAAQDVTMERQIPSLAYQATFSLFYEGEYADAVREFQTEGRRGIKLGLNLWIDSICYHTMTGECYYHMGQLGEALEHYTAALKLYIEYSTWMNQVRFPQAIRPSRDAPRIPWGASQRPTVPGYYPSVMQIGRGRLDNSQIVRQGGVIEDPQYWLVNAQEIVRCTTVAIRRRAELLGPAAAGDELTVKLIAELSARPGPPNNWSQAWVDVQLGLALAAGGNIDEAIGTLKRGVVAAGRYEHPLSSTALLALGHLTLHKALAEQNPNPAAFANALGYFEEATYSAVQYPNGDVLEEAFRYAAITHMLANRSTMYAKLVPAIRWAQVKDLRQLQASLLLLAAENAAAIGHTRNAAGFLDDARAAIGRRAMGNGWVGARLNYLRALVAFQQGHVEPGSQALSAAMAYQQGGSRWMFRLGYIDRMFLSGTLSEREAMELYTTLLRDPTANDWLVDPMESLTTLVTPHVVPMEHWFLAALNRGNNAAHARAALEIADRIRRHRFYTTLPMGGRLQSLRWTLEAPPEALDERSKLVRQSLLVQYPAYKTVSDQAEALHARLRAAPLATDDSKKMEELSRQLDELGRLGLQQEVMLRAIALRREPTELVFPPVVPIEEVQAKLTDGQAVLAFLVANDHVFGFLVGPRRIARWQLTIGPGELQKRIAALLREMGQTGPNSSFGEGDLTGGRWKESAADLLKALLLPHDGTPPAADFSQPFEELIVVPDGPLWYLPFEALQAGSGKQTLPLIAQARIRYAPTVSLAVPDGRTPPRLGKTAVVVGKLFPRDSDTVAQAAYEQLAGALPGCVALNTTLPAAPAVFSALVDRLIVLDDIRGWEQGPYAWSPIQSSRSRSGSALAEWLALPWEGPDTIVLPGYHTAAESALRGTQGMGGGEVFLTVCGLMSTGTRTVLLSRWRPGGQSSIDLVREFVAQLPHTTAADAWQRAVLLTAGSPLDIEHEPRVSLKQDRGLKATHPFFWSGYMLVDTGVDPSKEPPKPEIPGPGFQPQPLPGVGGQ